MKKADILRMEEEKIRELIESGVDPVSLDQTIMFGDQQEADRFEKFQQTVGKMQYEQDSILLEKWASEEKESR